MPRFRMQVALNVRERIEKLKQKELAEQLHIVQQLKSQMEQIRKSTAQSAQAVDHAKRHGLTIAQLQFNERYQKRMAIETDILSQKIQGQQQLADVKQQVLLKATQDKRVLEILKEKEAERYRKAMQKLERAEMDEISQNRHRAARQTK